MDVLYSDGTMEKNLHIDKKIKGIVLHNMRSQFGFVDMGRCCVFNLKDSSKDVTRNELIKSGCDFPDALDWEHIDIEKFNATVRALQEAGYDAQPLDPGKHYKCRRLVKAGWDSCVRVQEVFFDHVLKGVVEGGSYLVRACSYLN